MAHKVHPKIFRIKDIKDWHSRGFYERNFSEYLKEDFEIRQFLTKRLDKMAVEKIDIERFPGKINVIIFTARPGLIIGRGGGGVGELRKGLLRKLRFDEKTKRELRIEIRESREPWASANLAAQWIAQQIEKRVPFRRVLKQALSKIMATKGVQGARVEVAGRLDGAEIARTEWLREGNLPRQTLRADIDYAQTRAHCTYGTIGVKVWIYKGERFES